MVSASDIDQSETRGNAVVETITSLSYKSPSHEALAASAVGCFGRSSDAQ